MRLRRVHTKEPAYAGELQGEVVDCLRRVHTPAACGGTEGLYPESNTLSIQPYPVRSAAGLVDLASI
jgi:hypothetical protein